MSLLRGRTKRLSEKCLLPQLDTSLLLRTNNSSPPKETKQLQHKRLSPWTIHQTAKTHIRKNEQSTYIPIIMLFLLLTLLFAAAAANNVTNSSLTLDCIRMFYSDTWNKGYVSDLAKFCNG